MNLLKPQKKTTRLYEWFDFTNITLQLLDLKSV